MSPAATTVGLTASSTDPDGDTLVYSIASDSSGGGFAIDSRTGVVTVADGSKLGYASSGATHSYSLTIQASDGTLTSSSSFSIAVTPSTITLDPVGTNGTVSDAQAEGSLTISGSTVGVAANADVTIEVSRAGGVGHSYTVADTGSGFSLQLSPPTGKAFAGGSYTITADATDANGHTVQEASETVTVQGPPTVALDPVDGNNTVTFSQAAGPVTISGETTGVEDNATVSIHISKPGGIIHDYTATVTNNAYSLQISPLPGKAFAAGSYTIVADVTDANGVAAQEVSETVTVQAAGSTHSSAGELIDLSSLLASPASAAPGPIPALDLAAGGGAAASYEFGDLAAPHLTPLSEHAFLAHEHLFGHMIS